MSLFYFSSQTCRFPVCSVQHPHDFLLRQLLYFPWGVDVCLDLTPVWVRSLEINANNPGVRCLWRCRNRFSFRQKAAESCCEFTELHDTNESGRPLRAKMISARLSWGGWWFLQGFTPPLTDEICCTLNRKHLWAKRSPLCGSDGVVVTDSKRLFLLQMK